ncbi:pfs domain-containing protein [Colletotrichum navitas]|uniref:Pfs domain-containing protein n=1 Tax=Colletotrichum navitas TaxID=681940 RepID=A0AAD8UYV1_9PEZI|nr:pfs domain-containing protein [Colletotrichum navitas]KAK1570107.1 pfs domain-containing protein [Colletotrichum navitas]
MTTRAALSVQHADFELHWDPVHFAEQQGYPDVAALHNALTISGSATNAQLLPCLSYLRQCWPLLGEDVLSGLTSSLAGGTETNVEKSLYDGTVVSYRLYGTDHIISCTGMVDSIVDVAEVLAWLGSALREAGSKYKIAYITPHISCASKTGSSFTNLDPSEKTRFVLRFEEQDTEYRETKVPNGLCWFGLFGNPVIARGFPVLRRGHDFDGLEIPLPVMAYLADANKLTLFNNQVLLKGFNVALVPSSRSGDIIAWHLVMNKTGERLPYYDDRILKLKTQDESISMWNVHGSRHVLGWTSEALCNIGSPDANYHDLWTDPDFVRPGFVLEKFIVQGGPEFLTFGVEIAVGKKDPSPAIRRGKDSYLESLELLENEYIVLYDTGTRQAWLSNGVNALLHLVRASLKENLVGSSSRHYIFTDSKLRESADPCSSRAAMDVLEDEDNLQMPILRPVFRGTGLGSGRSEIPSLFIDRVNQIRLCLEQLLDFQAQVNTPGMPLHLAPRSQLEGYVFMDIATRQRPKPRFVNMRQSKFSGNSWVDFTRTIGAITLFGHGFGNLITPAPGLAGLCDNWRLLPEGKNFLAVSNYDLMNILRKRGPQDARHFKLCTGLFWHRPAELFEDCVCKSRLNWGLQRPCDKVQVILPATSLRKLGGTTPPGPLDPRGAVIFGHSSRFPWRLPDKGDIEKDNEPEQVTDDSQESVAATRVSSPSIFSSPPSQDASTVPTQDTSQTGITTALNMEKASIHQDLQTMQDDPMTIDGSEVHAKESNRSIKRRWRTFMEWTGSSGQASGSGKN